MNELYEKYPRLWELAADVIQVAQGERPVPSKAFDIPPEIRATVETADVQLPKFGELPADVQRQFLHPGDGTEATLDALIEEHQLWPLDETLSAMVLEGDLLNGAFDEAEEPAQEEKVADNPGV